MDRHAAVAWNHRALTEYLLAHGCDPSIRDRDGDTPLHVCEDPDLARLLLQNRASPTLLNNDRRMVGVGQGREGQGSRTSVIS